MAGQTYRLRTVRGDAQFEVEGDKDFVLEMLQRFEDSGFLGTRKARVEPKDERPKEPEAPRQKPIAVREFIQRVGAKRHADKVLAFAYYLEKYGGKSQFTAADINNLYYEAKLDTSNTSQAIINNIKRGYMMEAPGQKKRAGKKRYMLTQTGEEQVEAKL